MQTGRRDFDEVRQQRNVARSGAPWNDLGLRVFPPSVLLTRVKCTSPFCLPDLAIRDVVTCPLRPAWHDSRQVNAIGAENFKPSPQPYRPQQKSPGPLTVRKEQIVVVVASASAAVAVMAPTDACRSGKPRGSGDGYHGYKS